MADRTNELKEMLKRVCNAALPVSNSAYNLGQHHEQWDSIRTSITALDDARRAAVNLINDMGLAPTALPTDKCEADRNNSPWISVKDRLPAHDVPVLVAVAWERFGEDDDGRPFSTTGVDVTEGQYRSHPAGGYMESFQGQHGDAQDITHWMPLPEAPV